MTQGAISNPCDSCSLPFSRAQLGCASVRLSKLLSHGISEVFAPLGAFCLQTTSGFEAVLYPADVQSRSA